MRCRELSSLCFLQYDNTGWAPKEYNPDQDVATGHMSGMNHDVTAVNDGKGHYRKGTSRAAGHGGQGDIDTPSSAIQKSGTSERIEAPQSGFVWDEASGYYCDAASGFYYDGHRGTS
jgi:RNA-binding protein 5/10